jgi:hypothetical protein
MKNRYILHSLPVRAWLDNHVIRLGGLGVEDKQNGLRAKSRLYFIPCDLFLSFGRIFKGRA